MVLCWRHVMGRDCRVRFGRDGACLALASQVMAGRGWRTRWGRGQGLARRVSLRLDTPWNPRLQSALNCTCAPCMASCSGKRPSHIGCSCGLLLVPLSTCTEGVCVPPLTNFACRLQFVGRRLVKGHSFCQYLPCEMSAHLLMMYIYIYIYTHKTTLHIYVEKRNNRHWERKSNQKLPSLELHLQLSR